MKSILFVALLALCLAKTRLETTEEVVDHDEVQNVDGTGNNRFFDNFGTTGTMSRFSGLLTDEQIAQLPNPRVVSNRLVNGERFGLNKRFMKRETDSFLEPPRLLEDGLTDFIWLWGQFIDHDITIVEESSIHQDGQAPADDPFCPSCTIPFPLSVREIDEETGEELLVNGLTAFIDATSVYGFNQERLEALQGENGKMLVDPQNPQFLPTVGYIEERTGEEFEMAMRTEDSFAAGDVRANENIALASLHTLWLLEHNRIVDELIACCDEEYTAEEKFNIAKRRVIGLIQHITFAEWLPIFVGPRAPIGQYEGYNALLNPNVFLEFGTVAFRIGHTMVSDKLQVGDENDPNTFFVQLSDAFFNPQLVRDLGIGPILLGASQHGKELIDTVIVDELRNLLFTGTFDDNNTFLDLSVLNLLRGRDHRIPLYNDLREAFFLERYTEFSQITSNAQVAQGLEDVYGDIDLIEPWIGGLAEDHLPGAILGELFATIMGEQFSRLRYGDRFWHERFLTPEELNVVKNTFLADVVKRNTGFTPELNMFRRIPGA